MGTVTDLEEWRRTHGPAVRCVAAMQRAECMRRLGAPVHEQFVSGDAVLGATDG